MIYDQENIFFDAVTSPGTSDVIANVGSGDAACPLFLVVHTDTDISGATFTLQTAEDEEFSTPVELGAFAAASGTGLVVKAKLPYGALDFLRLVASGATGATVTAALTETVPNWNLD